MSEKKEEVVSKGDLVIKADVIPEGYETYQDLGGNPVIELPENLPHHQQKGQGLTLISHAVYHLKKARLSMHDRLMAEEEKIKSELSFLEAEAANESKSPQVPAKDLLGNI